MATLAARTPPPSASERHPRQILRAKQADPQTPRPLRRWSVADLVAQAFAQRPAECVGR